MALKTSKMVLFRIPLMMEFKCNGTTCRIIEKTKTEVMVLKGDLRFKQTTQTFPYDKVLEISLSQENWDRLVEGVAVGMIIQSHLSDVQAVPESETANKKLNFVKLLVQRYKNMEQLVTESELDALWDELK